MTPVGDRQSVVKCISRTEQTRARAVCEVVTGLSDHVHDHDIDEIVTSAPTRRASPTRRRGLGKLELELGVCRRAPPSRRRCAIAPAPIAPSAASAHDGACRARRSPVRAMLRVGDAHPERVLLRIMVRSRHDRHAMSRSQRDRLRRMASVEHGLDSIAPCARSMRGAPLPRLGGGDRDPVE